MTEQTPSEGSRTFADYAILFIRYGVGSILIGAGVVLLIVNPGGFGVEGFGLLAGSGASILALNFLYRLGVSGDEERRREEEARVYLAEHGRWPDEPAPEPPPAEPEPAAAAAAASTPARRDPDAQDSSAHPHDEHHDPGKGQHGDHAGRRTGFSRELGPRHRRRGPG
jgi:hypothetical protein